MIFFKVRADGSVVWQPYLGLRQHVDLLRRTLANEALVQQVLAAWRTATAGRPKGEDLYSPRKDPGALQLAASHFGLAGVGAQLRRRRKRQRRPRE